MKTRQFSHLSAWLGMLALWLGCAAAVAQDQQVVIIEVSGTIDLGLAPFTRRVLQNAEQVKAAAVILHIHTPGGRVDAAMQMRDALLNSRIETVAFIDKEAYSAGAQLQIDQAEADKRIAQAKAEERRAMAVAMEQEMKARVQEMQAKLVEAEAQVPMAIAEAFRQGNISVREYYDLRNVQADTQMRESLAGGEEEGRTPEEQ